MCLTGLRYWFLIEHKDDRKDINLVPAVDIDEVVERCEGIIGKAKLIRLTWNELKELTGCIIPSICNPKNYASGGIMFHQGDHLITIWT